jgi:hypothetical protein
MNIYNTLQVSLLAGLLILTSFSPVRAGENVNPKLMIMPFTLNAPDDLLYLKEGVRSMLASRIAARGGVEMLVGGQSENDPALAAKALGADLVLTGSITILGPSVSIDARLVMLKNNDAASFFAVADNQGGVIAAVEQLAADITGKISGKNPQSPELSKTNTSPQGIPEPVESSGQSLHPDRLFKAVEPAPAPLAVLPGNTGVDLPAPWAAAGPSNGSVMPATRSQFLDLEIQAMDVGDVFAAGSDQIVVAEKQRITVFRQDGNQLVKVGEVPAPPRHVRVIALNLADLNGNGRDEIYISAISDNNPFSYAVEWDGRNFIKLFDRQRHYLRPILLPGQGWGLYGQQAGFNAPVKAGIFKAKGLDGSLSTTEKLAVPEGINLYEFVLGDFTGDGLVETAVQTQDDDLFLYNSGGELLWHGSGNYGYTLRYLGPSYTGRMAEHKNLQVPTRLLAIDFNGDGRLELVAMENPSGLASLVKTVGSFVGGSIKIMGWNGVTFNDLWSTGAIGSYVASYQVKGTVPRLYIGMVSKKSGTLFNKRQSVVASYSLADQAR